MIVHFAGDSAHLVGGHSLQVSKSQSVSASLCHGPKKESREDKKIHRNDAGEKKREIKKGNRTFRY